MKKNHLQLYTVTIGRTTLVSASFPKTEKRMREIGITTNRIEISEFEKAEGGLSCLSLILETWTANRATART